MNELKTKLVARACELGFDSCRIAPCDPPTHAREFQDWLRIGAAGEMTYMERAKEKRCDPQLVLPGARSVVVLAMNYWQGDDAREQRTEDREQTGSKRPTRLRLATARQALNSQRPTSIWEKKTNVPRLFGCPT